jgi:hypothetical protein
MSAGPLTKEQLTTLIARYDVPGNSMILKATLQDAARLGMDLAAQICEQTVKQVNYSNFVNPLIPTNVVWAGQKCASAIRERARK